MSLPSSSKRFHLWVDGCGGFSLVLGDQVRIGRGEHRLPNHSNASNQLNANDVAIQADVPRRAGTLYRRAQDYFWVAEGGTAENDGIWIENGSMIPLSGSANLTLSSPSPLTSTAMLSLTAPHRFFSHVDQVVLVNDVLLIGPTADCHIQVTGLKQTSILRWTETGWQIRELVPMVGLQAPIDQIPGSLISVTEDRRPDAGKRDAGKRDAGKRDAGKRESGRWRDIRGGESFALDDVSMMLELA